MFKRKNKTSGEALLEIRKCLDQSYKVHSEVTRLGEVHKNNFSEEIESMEESTRSIIDSLSKTYQTALRFEEEAERFKELNLGKK